MPKGPADELWVADEGVRRECEHRTVRKWAESAQRGRGSSIAQPSRNKAHINLLWTGQDLGLVAKRESS